MGATISQIIATINPDRYLAVSDKKDEAKRELKEFKEKIKKEGFQKAALTAKPKAESEHKLIYDSSSETLDSIYYWLVDMMGDFQYNTEKLVDNFTYSPDTTFAEESGRRRALAQQQASKIMLDINGIIRSVMNILYDLRDFKTRLQTYKDLDSSDENKKSSALLALKQIWLDKVDVQRGIGSIHQMTAGQLQFVTLRDAFMAAETAKAADGLDLNERVKRILKARLHEFEIWLNESKLELTKRFNIQKNYLRSQVASLKQNVRWVKPYLKTASELEQKENDRNAAVVKAFNRIVLELTLFGKAEFKSNEPPVAGFIKDLKASKKYRRYYSCILLDFVFRATPRQGYYIGRTEFTLKSYSLNEEEIKKMLKELENSDLNEALKLMKESTGESLEEIEKEVNEYLREKDEEEKENKKEEKSSGGVNPFLALIGHYEKSEEPKDSKKSGSEEEIKIKSETWIEKEYFRKLAAEKVIKNSFDIFDIYKKAHGMPSYT